MGTEEDFVAKGPDAPPRHRGFFAHLGRLIANYPVPFLLFMPCVCLGLFGWGFTAYQIEDQVANIWIQHGGQYWRDTKYANKVRDSSAVNSGVLGISIPRKGGNILTADYMLEIRDRLNETENIEINVDGDVYTFDDICLNSLGPYEYPCYRMTALDCFYEGGYRWGPTAKSTWQEAVVSGYVESQLTYYVNVVKNETIDEYIATLGCSSSCADNYAAAASAYPVLFSSYDNCTDFLANNGFGYTCATQFYFSETFAGVCTDTCGYCDAANPCNMSASWDTDTDCIACVDSNTDTMTGGDLDTVYYAALRSAYGSSYTDAQLDAIVEAAVESELETTYTALLAGKYPYNFKIDLSPLGTARQPLNYQSHYSVCADRDALLSSEIGYTCSQASALCSTSFCPDCEYAHYCDTTCGYCGNGNVNDSIVLETASETCYNWDEGAAYPINNQYLTLGDPSPKNFSKHDPLTRVKALQHVYIFLPPEDIITRVANTKRPGGALTISKNRAKNILEKFKKKFEKTFSSGWNDDDGDVQFNCFSDDRGAGGTFSEMLGDLTASSVDLSVICFVVIIVIAIMFFVNFFDAVHSRVGLATVGTFFAIFAFLGAMGVTGLVGISINIVHMWTLPFLIVGLGVDDMYIISLSAVDVPIGTSYEEYVERFVLAYTSISSPVSVTSLVNAGMFGMLLLSTIPAVFLTAWTALFAIVLLYCTMMTALAALVALDMRRQMNGRVDVLCCMTSEIKTDAETDHESSKSYIVAHRPDVPLEEETGMWAALKRMYINFLKQLPVHVLVLCAMIFLLIFAGFGIANVPIGLDLEDFFPANSQGGEFTKYRMKYFPVWPETMNWKEMQYANGNVQMRMVKNWEQVLDTDHIIDGVSSLYVWTAALAYWALPESYNIGNCKSGNAITLGNCGPKLNANCTSSFTLNTFGLKTTDDDGYCVTASDLGIPGSNTYCPVLDGLSDDQFATCVSLWVNYTNGYSLTDPNLNFEDDGITPRMPIKYSRASGSNLFAYKLDEAEDYVRMINQVRDKCNGKCFMSGIAINYYEQYIGIRTWLLMLSLYALAAGFAIASTFIFGELILDERYVNQTIQKKILVSWVGALIITFIAGISTFTVVGISSWLEVKLCGFSAMSYLMTVGFAVEYSVHITHRFLTAPPHCTTGADKMAFALDLLSRPMFMSFTSSAVGVFCLLFSTFVFVRVYFFIPLVTVLGVTYFYGVIFLPVLLQYTACGCLDLHEGEHEAEDVVDIGAPEIGEKGL